jgi:hypothetical protein
MGKENKHTILRLLVIKESPFPFPSVSTLYQTRRYSEVLHVQVMDEQHGKAEFDFTSPMHIVYVGAEPAGPYLPRAEYAPVYVP